MRFYEKYRGHRDKFEILAFHSASAKTFEELDEKMKDIVVRMWDGKNLPFPVLLDATGQSLRNFSITALGTAVLIDPQGRVVKGNAEEILAKELQKLIRTP